MIFRTIRYPIFVAFWLAIIFGFLFLPGMMSDVGREQKSISVCLWPDVIDPKFFKEFEKETGIKVYVTYFDSNEELLVKMLATKGQGYDLISPSDYAIEFMAQHGLLKPLDKSKLDFFGALNQKLMGHYFDPNNDYSIPSEWYILGIAINKKEYAKPVTDPTLKIVFDAAYGTPKLGLINDPRELIQLTAYYLFGYTTFLTEEQVQQIKELLLEQKKNVVAYTDFRADFLLQSGTCSVVLASNAIVWKTLQEDLNIAFYVPREGAFLSMENYVIPATSEKEEYVYQFMNFLFSPAVQRYNFENHSYLSTRVDADYMYDVDELKESLAPVDPRTDIRLQAYRNIAT